MLDVSFAKYLTFVPSAHSKLLDGVILFSRRDNSATMEPTGLLRLPSEVLLGSCENMGNTKDLAALSKTCRRSYPVVNSLLYKLDVPSGQDIGLDWAAKHGLMKTAKLFIDS